MKLKVVYQTSINAPRQKTQAIVKQACQKAGIESRSSRSPRRCSSPRTSRTRTPIRTSPATFRCTRRRCGSRTRACSCGSSCRARSRARRTSSRAATSPAGRTRSTTSCSSRATSELDPVKRAALFIAMNDLVIKNVVVIPVVTRPSVAAVAKNLHAPLSGWDNNTVRSAGLVSRRLSGRRRTTGEPLSHPPLLIAMPSLLGISIVLFTVLALAPGDPFGELATNPAIPPEVQAALRAKFGLDDPIPVRYLHWLTAMLHGDWGFSFVSRINVDTLILQRLPTTLGGDRRVAGAGAAGRAAGRRLRGDAALFDLRPDRQHVRLDRLLAADLLHRHRVHPAVQRRARLAAVRVPLRPVRAPGLPGGGRSSSSRSCRSPCSACSRARPGRASCAPPCST